MNNWPVYNVETRSVARLKINEHNSRIHSDEQVQMIARSIKEWGWTMPILIDVRNTLIAGEGRLRAALSLGVDEVPVIIAKGWSDAQKRAYLIADNRLTELGEWDRELLRLELDALKLEGFELDLTGFDLDEFPAEQESPEEFNRMDEDSMELTYCCPKCGYQWSGKPK